MTYTNHKFCWHGVVTTDPDKAAQFYPEVLGWNVQQVPMGENEATVFSAADGAPRAHLEASPEGPSHWSNYLRVENVDATTAAATENGGEQLVPPMDIPPGRFSLIRSPSGATVNLFHEADPSAEDAGSGQGSIHWTELHSTDLEADLAWLKNTFGYATEEMPIPNGTYYILKDGETICGGAMQHMQEGAPSMWLSWVEVESVDETVTRVEANGGQLLSEPMDMEGIGRMAVVSDNTQGVFGVITPAAQG